MKSVVANRGKKFSGRSQRRKRFNLGGKGGLVYPRNWFPAHKDFRTGGTVEGVEAGVKKRIIKEKRGKRLLFRGSPPGAAGKEVDGENDWVLYRGDKKRGCDASKGQEKRE